MAFLTSDHPLSVSSPFKTIPQGSVGMVTRFGKYYRSVDPGLYHVNLLAEKIVAVDIKIQIQEIPRQVC